MVRDMGTRERETVKGTGNLGIRDNGYIYRYTDE